MERRGFLGTVGATIAALLIPWKDVPELQAKDGNQKYEVLEGPMYGAVRVPPEPVPRKVMLNYKGHPQQEGPEIPAGKSIEIPFVVQEEFQGIDILYPEGPPEPGKHVMYEVRHGTS